MKLTGRVRVVGGGGLGYGLSSYYDCNVYALDCGNGEYTLIDAGSGIEPELLLRRLEEDGIAPERVTRLLLTHGHADHAGGAGAIRERLGVEVVAAEETARMVELGDEVRTSLAEARASGTYPPWYRLRPCRIDRTVAAGDKITAGDLSLQVIAAPGHSFDMVCYYCPELKALFSADAVFAGGKLAVIRTPDFSLDAYRQTITGLSKLEVEQLFPGHGYAVTERGGEDVAAAHRRFREGVAPQSIV
ncbi:MBL fold metallo-hydrolase [Paenibacillus oceani]|uniref:beta-lactamase n=1 Tax=Paenibacillus oceani TaxID=2772510 RepID=A0A927C8G9_9BACL|nr:MBL fold metallo-hydrolase [Paenibacillus oceani]MBD2861431.1 MBL fold metallo-hydrolase [Paenibacillus oceani]